MARFWEWGTRAASSRASSASVATATTLEPVELYTHTAMIFGLVAPDGWRLSDMLNTNRVLSLRDPRSTSLLPAVAGSQGDGWTSILRDDILFAMPPAHESVRQRRIPRREHRIRVLTGPFEVMGNAHVPPGVETGVYALGSGIQFLAMTDARVYSRVDPAVERVAPVVLVNFRAIADLTEFTRIS